MDLRPLNIISLCTGGGGLDRAVELAIPTARPVALVEREAFAVANLVAQMQQRVLAEAPIWSDVRTFPGRRFRGGVDGVIGGIPCQPYSLAGKRLGRADERDLWGAARRIFAQSGAWFILVENVGGMLSEGGAERVRGDLLRMGCAVEGGLFRASEVGFAQERERLFILGVADARCAARQRIAREVQRPQGTAGQSGGDRPEPQGAELAHAGGDGWGEGTQSPQGRQSVSPGAGDALANASVARLEGRAGRTTRDQRAAAQRGGPAVVDAEGVGRRKGWPEPELRSGRGPVGGAGLNMADALGRHDNGRTEEPEWGPEQRAAVEWASRGPLFIPGPGDRDGWAWIAEHYPERLPALSRHDLFCHALRKHGLGPDGRPLAGTEVGPSGCDPALRAAIIQEAAQSSLRRRPDGVATRIDELRMLGNGVVDLAGAYAVRSLATDLSARSAGAAELVRLMDLEPQDLAA